MNTQSEEASSNRGPTTALVIAVVLVAGIIAGAIRDKNSKVAAGVNQCALVGAANNIYIRTPACDNNDEFPALISRFERDNHPLVLHYLGHNVYVARPRP